MNANTATLEIFRATYLAAVDALIERFPAQAQNRPSYEMTAGAFRLGTLTRAVRTSLHSFPKGATVCFLERTCGEIAKHSTVEIWAPGLSDGCTGTITGSSAVRAVCLTCGDTGRVRHVDGLISFACPSC